MPEQITLNVNDSCRVRLTQRGADIFNEVRNLTSNLRVGGDYLELQLWNLMAIFGPVQVWGLGPRDIPFYENSIVVTYSRRKPESAYVGMIRAGMANESHKRA